MLLPTRSFVRNSKMSIFISLSAWKARNSRNVGSSNARFSIGLNRIHLHQLQLQLQLQFQFKQLPSLYLFQHLVLHHHRYHHMFRWPHQVLLLQFQVDNSQFQVNKLQLKFKCPLDHPSTSRTASASLKYRTPRTNAIKEEDKQGAPRNTLNRLYNNGLYNQSRPPTFHHMRHQHNKMHHWPTTSPTHLLKTSST